MVKSLYRILGCAAGVLLFAGVLPAGEKKLMHCFYFTAAKDATEADWQAFYKATDELPGKVPGLTRVWYGKLLRPRAIYFVDSEAAKKLRAGEEKAQAEVSARVRQYGVCMELNDESALKTYGGHPAHKTWEEVYSKVREPETTTFDIIGR